MKISIVIPTLNEEKYLEESLLSIQSQKGINDYEIIIADGGSDDRTISIAKKYADFIIYEPHRTIAAGRQSGSLIASGDILVCANADVIYKEDWLKNLIKPFENENVVAVIGKTMPKDGDNIDKIFSEYFLSSIVDLSTKLNIPYADSSNLAVRKNAFFKIGGFKRNLVTGEDTELIKRIRKHGKIIYAKDAIGYVSMRRVKKWGRLYFFLFHFTNFFRTYLFNSGHKRYEPIR